MCWLPQVRSQRFQLYYVIAYNLKNSLRTCRIQGDYICLKPSLREETIGFEDLSQKQNISLHRYMYCIECLVFHIDHSSRCFNNSHVVNNSTLGFKELGWDFNIPPCSFENVTLLFPRFGSIFFSSFTLGIYWSVLLILAIQCQQIPHWQNYLSKVNGSHSPHTECF